MCTFSCILVLDPFFLSGFIWPTPVVSKPWRCLNIQGLLYNLIIFLWWARSHLLLNNNKTYLFRLLRRRYGFIFTFLFITTVLILGKIVTIISDIVLWKKVNQNVYIQFNEIINISKQFLKYGFELMCDIPAL